MRRVGTSAFGTRAPSRAIAGPTGSSSRLQGTILQEHWRVVFRRRYFTSRLALQRSLDGFMRDYNEERRHHGYRVRGRTPAALVWGAVRHCDHAPLWDDESVNTVSSLDKLDSGGRNIVDR